MIGDIIKAAIGSAHQKPQAAFNNRPAKRIAER
jgi:hypothetical protein